MPGLALFDFDGTITFKDTFTAFIFYAVAPLRMATGALTLSPLLAAYKAGLLPATKMRAAIVKSGFRGRGAAEVQHLGRAFARETIARVLRPEAMARIQWHKEQGDVIVVVSASLDVYLTDWCEGQGLELICTRLEADGGILTGRYLGGDCTGGEKAKRILAGYDLDRYECVYAYGDTHEDMDMLKLARRRYFRWEELPERSGAL